ncbi:MAG: LacI family DNA-binding transcriptional regulator, partial [Burkholderiaceae bacterium]|nr:LacI family DNA-binding transcriptional regulator [Microbacteriaceae bacterium]
MAVTRADVARRAGVSPAVVSYVLNPGSRPVSAGARARIEQAILETGYRPNAIAQALRRSSTMSIGLMVPDLSNSSVATLVRSIEDIAYEHGYVMFVGTVGQDLARERRYLRTYVDRQVDALIMIGAHSDHLVDIAAQHIPVVVLDPIPHGLGISSVVPEYAESSAAAVRHLIEKHGHTHIGCVTGGAGGAVHLEDRVSGWRSALTAAGLPHDDTLLRRMPGYTRSDGIAAALSLLETERPTALFVTTDTLAVGVTAALRARGVAVPADVAVISYDGTDLARDDVTSLSSVEPDLAALANTIMTR